MERVTIQVSRYDIFDYVVGNSTFDPIEKCINPIRYEVFDTFIFDSVKKMQHRSGRSFL